MTLDFDSDKTGLPPAILFDRPRRRPSIDDSRQVQNGPGNMDQNESDNGQNELSQTAFYGRIAKPTIRSVTLQVFHIVTTTLQFFILDLGAK